MKVIQAHIDKVVGGSLHPCKDYFATASPDQTWRLFDIQTGSCIARSKDTPDELLYIVFGLRLLLTQVLDFLVCSFILMVCFWALGWKIMWLNFGTPSRNNVLLHLTGTKVKSMICASPRMGTILLLDLMITQPNSGT